MGAFDGPFNIIAGSNDTLIVSVNQSAPQTVTLGAATGLSANQVAYRLNLALQGIFFTAAGARVSFMTTTEGASCAVFFQTGSTLCSTLGFKVNREFRGQQIVPGWTVINDPQQVGNEPNRLILFDMPLRSGTDFVEIDYTTTNQNCRRCGGTGVEFDWRIGRGGDVVTVQDEALLIQELEKDFFTILGSNPFHTWYGTNLLDSIGKKLTMGGFVQNLIVSDIYTAFQRWQQIKDQQQNKLGQTVTDKEYPFRLVGVQLQQSTQDPTVIFVNITVMNRSNQPIQIFRGIKTPLPLDLLGSTQQQGIIRQSLSSYVLTG